MDWQQTTLTPAGRDAFVQWVRTPVEQRDAVAAERSVRATEQLLALLDTHLEARDFMGGDRFTMADIPIGCELPPLVRPASELYRRRRRGRGSNVLRVAARRPAARGVLDLTLA